MTNALRALVLTLLALPSLAPAQVSLGLRVGYALPAGDAYDFSGQGTFSQKEFAESLVPIQIDAAWRFTPKLSAGLYYSYGFGQTGSKLDELCSTPGATCDDPVFQRFGAAATYRHALGSVVPWASLGLGMELAKFAVSEFVYNAVPLLTADLEGSFRGWNANLGVGADWALGDRAALGPYVQLDVAQYRVEKVTMTGQGTVASGSIDEPKTHEWITIGLRGTFDL